MSLSVPLTFLKSAGQTHSSCLVPLCWQEVKCLRGHIFWSVSVHVCENIWVSVNRKGRIIVYVWACLTPSLMMSLHLLKLSFFHCSRPAAQAESRHQHMTGKKSSPALPVNSFISQLAQTGLRVSTDVPQCNKDIDLDGDAENGLYI